MSCLYSSPEVSSLEVKPRVKRLESQILSCRLSRLIRTVRRAPSAHVLCSSISHGFCRTSQSTKTRSPAIRRSRAGCAKSFSLRKQARMSHVKIQAQSQLSFALRSQWRSSQKPSRSIGPAFWNLSIGRALALRSLTSSVEPTGPVTLNRICERNVVGPGGYSKRFFPF